jgi:hypothetical protein
MFHKVNVNLILMGGKVRSKNFAYRIGPATVFQFHDYRSCRNVRNAIAVGLWKPKLSSWAFYAHMHA